MSPRDDRLKELFREASESRPAPDFERTWRRAGARVGAKERGSLWQWAIGPTLAAVSAAVIAVAVLGSRVDEPRAPAPRATAERQAATVIADAGTGAATGGAAAIVAESSSTSNGMYVGETDFLLEVNIPAWN